MKYRPISSELNASFAELSVFLSWWITLICSQKSIFELKRVEIWKLIKLRVKAVIVLQYAFTSVVVNQMHVFHKSTGTLANLNEVLPACLTYCESIQELAEYVIVMITRIFWLFMLCYYSTCYLLCSWLPVILSIANHQNPFGIWIFQYLLPWHHFGVAWTSRVVLGKVSFYLWNI